MIYFCLFYLYMHDKVTQFLVFKKVSDVLLNCTLVSAN